MNRFWCSFFVFVVFSSVGSDAVAQPQRWVTATQDTLQIEVVETGEIGAVKSTTVAAPQIWSLDMQIIDMVAEGTQVDSGMVVVQFDRSALLSQLEEKQTELDMYRADLRRMRTEHQAKINELDREIELADYSLKLAEVQLEQMKYESQSNRDDGELEVLKAKIALKEAKTKRAAQAIINDSEQKKQQLLILQAQGEVNRIQRDLDQMTLHAPISGMAVYHPDWDGNKPQVGDKVRPGRGVIDLPDLSRMQVKIRVNEVDIARFRNDQTALVTLDAFPEKKFHARLTSITRIANTLEQNSQVRVFDALLEIAETDSLLKPGMTAKVRVQIDNIADATVIPLGSVFEVDGQPVVFTKRSPRSPISIEILGRNDFYAAVTGIAVGTEISWQPGTTEARPLGYQAYRQSVRPPDTMHQEFFTEMEKRNLTFDYEAFRNRPPEPPGGAPGGTNAMLKKLGFPQGEMAGKTGAISLTPEMLKDMQAAGATKMPSIAGDSTSGMKAMSRRRDSEKKPTGPLIAPIAKTPPDSSAKTTKGDKQ